MAESSQLVITQFVQISSTKLPVLVYNSPITVQRIGHIIFSRSIFLHQAPFIEEMVVVLVRKHHPQMGEEMDMELFSSLKHVTIDSFEASHGVKQIWQESKAERIVALRSPNFLSPPLILAESDMIATLPLEIARMFTHGGRLKLVPCPLAVDQVNLEMVWHNLLEKDVAQNGFENKFSMLPKDCKRMCEE